MRKVLFGSLLAITMATAAVAAQEQIQGRPQKGQLLVAAGIQGHVLTGGGVTNQIVADGNLSKPQGAQAVQNARIYVFRGQQQNPDIKSESCVAMTTTNKDGQFAIGLQPGQYSLFMERQGQLQPIQLGNQQTAEVASNRWLALQLTQQSN